MAIEATGDDLVVIASNPQELAESQTATIERIEQKKQDAIEEAQEHKRLVEACVTGNINADRPKRLHRLATKRVTYYDKMKRALEAGYVLVPNFPADTIAIRTKRNVPKIKKGNWQSHRNAADASVPDEPAERLPAGEGRYVSPLQGSDYITRERHDDRFGMVNEIKAIPISLRDEINLPAEFQKPTVVERTTKGMARKIFDDIAIAPFGWGRQGDPMVLGRIYDPRGNDRMVSFLIAWFIDTAEL